MYEVLSISRLVLSSLGFTTEQIKLLTDEDMQAIADGIADDLSKSVGGLQQQIEFVAALFIAERSTDVQTTQASHEFA